MLSGLSVTLLNKEQLESTRKQFKSSSIIVTSAEVLFTQPLQSGPDVRNTVCVCVCVCECACVPVCVCVGGGGGGYLCEGCCNSSKFLCHRFQSRVTYEVSLVIIATAKKPVSEFISTKQSETTPTNMKYAEIYCILMHLCS